MKRRLAMGLLLAVTGVAFWYVQVRWFSDQARAARAIRSLASSVSFTPRDGTVARVARAEGLAAHFLPDAEIHIDQVVRAAGPLSGQEDIRQAALGAFRVMEWVEFTVHDVAAQVTGPGEAQASFTASLRSSVPGADFFGQEFEARLAKDERHRWRIRRIDAVHTLKR